MILRALPVLAVLLTTLLAVDPAGAETKSGKAVLKDGIASAVKVNLGKQVKAECAFYITDFSGKKVIAPQAKIINTTKKPMFFAYHVAFLDKDKNLIGCTSFTSFDKDGMAPGKETFIGNIIEVPPAELKKVAFYLVTLYESDKQISQ